MVVDKVGNLCHPVEKMRLLFISMAFPVLAAVFVFQVNSHCERGSVCQSMGSELTNFVFFSYCIIMEDPYLLRRHR